MLHYKFMHIEFFKAAAGFVGAGISAVVVWVAQTAPPIPPDAKNWMEGGAYFALVSCLAYAIRHLNTERREERAAREKDRERWEQKWGEEHAMNMDAREKDRAIRERFAGAVEDLSRAVKEARKSKPETPRTNHYSPQD